MALASKYANWSSTRLAMYSAISACPDTSRSLTGSLPSAIQRRRFYNIEVYSGFTSLSAQLKEGQAAQPVTLFDRWEARTSVVTRVAHAKPSTGAKAHSS